MTHQIKGIFYVVGAFTLWGMFPAYWKLLSHHSGFEIVSHRIVWSVITGVLILRWLLREDSLAKNWNYPGHKKLFLLGGLCIGSNWSIYIYAVLSSQIVEGSLGYFITPLFSIFLGFVILKERLSRLQWMAVGLAAIGVLILALNLGKLPLISLGLATSFSLYGLVKKNIRVGSLSSVVFEAAFLLPLALGYLFWFYFLSPQKTESIEVSDMLLLVFSGVVTLTPLYLFAQATKYLRLTTIGFVQYLGPTLQLILAIFVYNEPFHLIHKICFGFIWAALFIYTLSNINQFKRR